MLNSSNIRALRKLGLYKMNDEYKEQIEYAAWLFIWWLVIGMVVVIAIGPIKAGYKQMNGITVETQKGK